MSVDIYDKQHLLTLSGGPVCVYESGDQSLPNVLLLHGAMYDESRFIWHHLAPELAKTRHVFAIDFPRHGKSRPWSGTIGQRRLVEIVREVVDHFNLAPLPVIGLSMGGGVAIGYGLQYPDRVSCGIFMGPGGLGDKVANQFLSWLYVKTPGSLRYLTKHYAKSTPEKMKKSVVSMLNDKEKSPDLDDLTEILMEEAQQKWKYNELSMDDWQMEGLAPFRLKMNFLPELHRLPFPVLWLRGKNDPLVGQSVMEEAARLSPNGRLQVIENAGHLIPLERPNEVSQIVQEFFLSNNL